jgi:hypothetical protein
MPFMSCVLRAIGESFDVDAFLGDSAFSRAKTFHRREPRSGDAGEVGESGPSGFNLPVSDAGMDELERQIQDAANFLREHEEELRRLSRFPGLEAVCLDFAIRRRDVPAQTDVFPADLLWQTGALDIDLVVTHYAVDDDSNGTFQA